MSTITFEEVERICLKHLGKTTTQIRIRTNQHEIAHARAIIFYFCRKYKIFKGNYQKIAERYGYDRTTAYHHKRNVDNFIETKDKQYACIIKNIDRDIKIRYLTPECFENIPQF